MWASPRNMKAILLAAPGSAADRSHGGDSRGQQGEPPWRRTTRAARKIAMLRIDTLRDRFERQLIILDGAVGTELERRGVDCSLPLWSARAIDDAPDTLAAIHREYV